jgi:nucleoside 2-deoxyribosyltransferase
MKRLFITASFQGGENKEEIEKLCRLVKKSGWLDFCFIRDVEHYQKMFSNPSQLMQRALEEIRKSDALLIDMTDKPTGRAIEAGIAYALGKTVIVICKTGTKIKVTTIGIAVETIEYESIEDIVDKLRSMS